MSDLINQGWHLTRRPVNRLTRENFTWFEAPVPALNDGEVRVRSILLSMDPTNRGWANKRATYLKPIQLGTPMRGTALGVVESSRHPDFAEGDIVMGMLGWQLYATLAGKRLTKMPQLPPNMPLEAHFGLLGHIGLTAYFGLLEIATPQAGETLVVNAAAGAVGSLVGQIGKIKGCRVVGIAGSDEKCAWLTDDLGFDAAINYKTQNIYKALRHACPDGIDVDFENVGGEIFDAILAQINNGARIALCGLIAQYNADKPLPLYHIGNILLKRARMEGFIVLDYQDRAMEAFNALIAWHQAGKLQYRVQAEDGLENAPEVLNMLFDGLNRGKLVLRVSEG